jgi:hypothetical protein
MLAAVLCCAALRAQELPAQDLPAEATSDLKLELRSVTGSKR